ncbi:Imm1 family immunity protein [Actinocrispum wychmicini]|uniref:Immunity protein Imm1 of predicted polymorphic toxin system n=1 Tax=Actinocrispum wychmicini TaxID=1213861 RepID=A0A4R2IVU9_9PSEU|nr:Imm1 family immunity protein [Actinocrispum wychmicini]TCO49833.1 immunity protein Imm1 of predicted polymorphic toxin system [Actinocrispum wychmicini]
MKTAAAGLLADGGADLRSLPLDLDLVDLLRTANAQRPKQAWTFYLDPSDRLAPSLTVGLNGPKGFVRWWTGKATLRPEMATLTGEYVDYWSGGHHFQSDIGEEVPAEYVFAVVVEFVATHRRPAWLRWEDNAA